MHVLEIEPSISWYIWYFGKIKEMVVFTKKNSMSIMCNGLMMNIDLRNQVGPMGRDILTHCEQTFDLYERPK